MEQTLQQIFDGVVAGDRDIVQEKVKEALDAGLEPAVILNAALIAAMAEVGRRFEAGEYYVPEMLVAARAMQAGLAILKPRLQQGQVKAAGRVAAGTVRGDLHDIGKNLVCMMLEGAGFEIHDLGTDVVPQKFVDIVRAGGVDVVAMSALLTTTMPSMKVTINALKEAGLRDQVKVIVGGAPVTADFAQQIGADGYAPDASRVVALVKSLLGAN
jgi:5-methyltetrahydrofolate--homocysteine methyltransferase